MTGPWTWRHVWPIVDPYVSRPQMRDEARRQLDAQLVGRRLIPVGEPVWRVCEDPDRRLGADLVLVATVNVIPAHPTTAQEDR